MSTLHIPALRGGGIIVGYQCTSECRHCLYACGPYRRDGSGSADRDRAAEALNGTTT